MIICMSSKTFKETTHKLTVEHFLLVVNELKDITPKEETVDLFITILTKVFHERADRFNKIRSEADNEIASLKALRKMLIEKNLQGTYSYEVFKEQSAL